MQSLLIEMEGKMEKIDDGIADELAEALEECLEVFKDITPPNREGWPKPMHIVRAEQALAKWKERK